MSRSKIGPGKNFLAGMTGWVAIQNSSIAALMAFCGAVAHLGNHAGIMAIFAVVAAAYLALAIYSIHVHLQVGKLRGEMPLLDGLDLWAEELDAIRRDVDSSLYDEHWGPARGARWDGD